MNTRVNDLKDPQTFTQLVTFFSQYYNLTGTLLSAEKANEEYGIPVGLVTEALENEQFRQALVERGINLDRFEADDWTAKSLTPVQLVAANQLLDLVDQRSIKKKLQDMGISTATYNAWLKDPVFKEYLHTRAEQLIPENAHEANTALLDKVRQGDLKAIAYLNEMTGRFVPQRAGANQFDAHSLIVKIIEIIDVHVVDADAKVNIANDLKRLIAANNVAAQLTGIESPVASVGVKEMASLVENEAAALDMPEVVEVNHPKGLGL